MRIRIAWSLSTVWNVMVSNLIKACRGSWTQYSLSQRSNQGRNTVTHRMTRSFSIAAGVHRKLTVSP